MKSDVWSLGCIAYEMCEFRSPFKHNEKMSLMDLFNNITKGEYKPVSTRYSQALRDVIDGMIMVDPNKRLDAPTVLQRAQANHQQLLEQKKTPQIYNILVMEVSLHSEPLAGYLREADASAVPRVLLPPA